MTEWTAAVPALVVALAVVLLPGLAVRLAAWGVSSLTPYLFVPAVSIAVLAVASNAAPLLRLPWGPLPVAIVTVVAVGIAFVLRRWVGAARDAELATPPTRLAVLAAASGAVLAGVVLGIQLARSFVSPANISQTFDNIVHLSAIRLTLDAGDASAFAVGRTSDIGFYPNAWHSLVTLATGLSGSTIPTGVNAANIVLGAVVWPISCMALAAVLFRERPAAVVGAAALSTGFGAFPFLLLSFGVLYPNATGYAVLPAGLAALLLLLRSTGARETVRNAVLLVVVCAAIGLGHPNAFLALYAMGAGVVVVHFARRIVARPRAAASLRDGSVIVAVLVVGALLWRFARTGSAMSQWAAWQSTAQAVGEAALVSPHGLPITIPLVALVVVGLVAIVVRPLRYADVGIPFVVASFMFVLVSGLPAGTVVRDLVTNPWYNDPYRLAALLPVAGIPVATLGLLVVVDAAATALRAARAPRALTAGLAGVGAIALFAVGVGPNAAAGVAAVRASYELGPDAPLLSTDEIALLERLPDEVPADAVMIANPWTGASLAYAFSDREVLSRHVFGTRTPDEVYLDENLALIDTDPDVCAAVDRLGVGWVVDFGARNVWSSTEVGLETRGLNDLTAGGRLQLVDSEGDAARLFRIDGC